MSNIVGWVATIEFSNGKKLWAYIGRGGVCDLHYHSSTPWPGFGEKAVEGASSLLVAIKKYMINNDCEFEDMQPYDNEEWLPQYLAEHGVSFDR